MLRCLYTWQRQWHNVINNADPPTSRTLPTISATPPQNKAKARDNTIFSVYRTMGLLTIPEANPQLLNLKPSRSSSAFSKPAATMKPCGKLVKPDRFEKRIEVARLRGFDLSLRPKGLVGWFQVHIRDKVSRSRLVWETTGQVLHRLGLINPKP